jgi:hypothetical protein
MVVDMAVVGVDMVVVVVDMVVVVADTVAVVVDMVVAVVVTAVEDLAVVMVWKLVMNPSTQLLQQILPMSMLRNCSTVVVEVEEEDTEVVVAAVEDMVVGDTAVAVEEDMAVEEVVGDMVADTRK